MTILGFDKPLYILPFDHRGSFQKKMFGWDGTLSTQQTAEIAAAKRVIYDAFVAAVDAGVPKDKAGILIDEQFGAAILLAKPQRHVQPRQNAGERLACQRMSTRRHPWLLCDSESVVSVESGLLGQNVNFGKRTRANIVRRSVEIHLERENHLESAWNKTHLGCTRVLALVFSTAIALMFSAPVIYTLAADTPLLEPHNLIVDRSLPGEQADAQVIAARRLRQILSTRRCRPVALRELQDRQP